MPRNTAPKQLPTLRDPKNPEEVAIFMREVRQIFRALDDTVATLVETVEAQATAGGGGITLPIAESDVTGLVADLAGKASVTHTHAEADVTGLVADLAGKAALAHTHAEADVTGLVADLAAKQPLDATLTALAGLDATAGLVEETASDTFTKRTIGVGASTSIPTRGDGDTRWAASSHSHAESDITSLVADLAAKVPTTRTITATSPIRIDSGNSANLSADRTISLDTTALVASLGWFGDGSDGALAFDGVNAVVGCTRTGTTYTVDRPLFASSVVISSGVTVSCIGNVVRCTGNTANAGKVECNGSNGTNGNNGGAGGAGGALRSGVLINSCAAGANGGNNGAGAPGTAGASARIPYGFVAGSVAGAVGAGGNGGIGQGAAGGGSGANAGGAGGTNSDLGVANRVYLEMLNHVLTGRGGDNQQMSGGSGGGGGRGGITSSPAAGGGGGGGGGGASFVWLSKTFSGAGTWESKGGTGGNGGAATGAGSGGGGGGGGGAGGTVVLIAMYGTVPTPVVTGGTGGSGGAGNGAGATGNNGGNGGSGIAKTYTLGVI